jgi:hypothetical protein
MVDPNNPMNPDPAQAPGSTATQGSSAPVFTPGYNQLAHNINDNYVQYYKDPTKLAGLKSQYGITDDQFNQATGVDWGEYSKANGLTPGGTTPAPAPAPAPVPGSLNSMQKGTTSGPFTVGGSTSTPGAPQLNGGTVAASTDWNVQPNQTVASQLEKVVASDSPIMQRARMQAQQAAQANGLSNSTMAGTAGEAAVLDRALPIAQADAATNARAGEVNAGATNTFTTASNLYARDANTANFNLAANAWAADQAAARTEQAAQRDFGRTQQAATTEYGRTQTAADANLGREQTLAGSNAGIQAGVATTAHDRALQQGYITSINSARSDYATALTNISGSSTMSSDVKAEAIRNLGTTYNTIIANYAKMLGWDASSWLIGTDTPTSAGATTTPTKAADPGYQGVGSQ